MKYIVMKVDTSEASSFKPEVVDICDSREEAKALARNEIEEFVDNAAGISLTVDFDRMSVQSPDGTYGCEWSINAFDISETTKKA